MGAMFLASALNRSIPLGISTNFKTFTGVTAIQQLQYENTVNFHVHETYLK